MQHVKNLPNVQGGMKNLQLNDDIASAPPLYSSTRETQGGREKMLANDEPHIKGPHLSDARNTSKSESGIRHEYDVGNRSNKHFRRLVLIVNL